MSRSRKSLLPSSRFTTLLSILVISTLSFAAAPDRISGAINTASMVSLGSGVPANSRLHAQLKDDQGVVEPSFQLSLTFVISPSVGQQNAIDKLLAQQQDPHSAYFHKWLTPEQYGDQFGLSPNDRSKITNWLQSQGFGSITIERSANIIHFTGTANQFERTFRSQVHRYQIEGKTQFSNNAPPQIPAALSGIVTGMRGLNNFRLKPMATRSLPSRMKASYYEASTGNQFLAPADINTIYDIKSSMTGAGQTIAIIGQTDIFEADLASFRTGFSLSPISGCTADPNSNVITACNTSNFKYVLYLPSGGSDPLGPYPGDLGEADLDIEWSGATAPGAQIIYVNAPWENGNGVVDSMSHAITTAIAPVVSMSYDNCELNTAVNAANGDTVFSEAEFQQASLQGMTIVNSTGDSGAAACDFSNTPSEGGYSVNYPASSPEVTAVGGTLIPYTEYSSPYWNTTGTTGGSAEMYIPEQGWNDAQQWGTFCAAASGNCTGDPFSDWASAQGFFGIIAGGGGVSNCATINASGVCLTGYARPSYQSHLNASDVNPGGLGQTTASPRFIPDVSLLASVYWPGYIFCTPVAELVFSIPDNIYASDFNSSCQTSIAASVAGIQGTTEANSIPPSIVGGTSVATPIFAGIVALMNQALNTNGLSNINTTLYSLAANPASKAFNIVTAGSNGAYCDEGEPVGQPAALQCPSTGTSAGFLGFDASNVDPTTNYNLVAGLGSVDVSNLATAWAQSLLAATATTISSSSPTADFGATVTFTATVTTTGTNLPTGTVTFFNGSTSIGTGTLATVGSSQQATFATSTLPAGTLSITATYGGDANNASSTSAVLTQTIVAPSFTLTNPTAFTSVPLAGQSTTSTFTVKPSKTTLVPITFACNGLPDSTVTCAFNPANIAVGAVGGTAVPVTVTITTSGPNPDAGKAQHRKRADNRSPWLPIGLPLAGIFMVGFAGRKMSKYSTVAGLCVSLMMLGLLVACGSSSHPPVSVAVSPSGATMFPNYSTDSWPSQGVTFTPTVTNSSNTAVTWSLSSSVSCTSAANLCGAITSGGAYTAPTIQTGLPASVTVTATSQADTTKTASSTVTLTPTTVPTAVAGGPYNIGVQVTEGPTSNPTATVPLTVN